MPGGDLLDHSRIDGEASIGFQEHQDLFEAPPERRRVPDADRSDPVEVHMLRTLPELRKAAQSLPHVLELRVEGLDQHGVVGLNDEGGFGLHATTSSAPRSRWRREGRSGRCGVGGIDERVTTRSIHRAAAT